MQRWKNILGFFLAGFACQAQTIEQKISTQITKVYYAPLAKQARVSGSVWLLVELQNSKAMITLISGHWILAPGSYDNLKQWAEDFAGLLTAAKALGFVDNTKANDAFVVQYEYKLIKPSIRTKNAPRGDFFDRIFLRAFKQPLEKPVTFCENSTIHAGPISYTPLPLAIRKTWIKIVAEAEVKCTQTEPVAAN